MTALQNTVEMSAPYSQYPFPAGDSQVLLDDGDFRRCQSHVELIKCWHQCLEEMGSIRKCSKGFPCFLEAVLEGCDSWLLEELQSSLLILCAPSPACAREMSVQVLAMKFRQPLSGSLCLDLAGRATL